MLFNELEIKTELNTHVLYLFREAEDALRCAVLPDVPSGEGAPPGGVLSDPLEHLYRFAWVDQWDDDLDLSRPSQLDVGEISPIPKVVCHVNGPWRFRLLSVQFDPHVIPTMCFWYILDVFCGDANSHDVVDHVTFLRIHDLDDW